MRKNDTTGLRVRRTLGVAAASVAVLAVAGVSATQAFAASGHHHTSVRGVVVAAGAVKHANPAKAPRARTNTDNPLAAAIAAVAQGTISNVDDSPLPASLHNPLTQATGLDFTPADGSGESQVFVAYHPAGYYSSPEGYIDWRPPHVVGYQVSDLPDGSRVRTFTAPQDTGELAVAERLVDGRVETLSDWSPTDAQGDFIPGGHPALSADQLKQVIARLAPPA
jgi:hypothetical protein